MAKGKSSTGGARNDGRSNGKAGKKNPGRKSHGSKSVKLSASEKILMGKGLYVRFERMNNEGARAMHSKRAKKD